MQLMNAKFFCKSFAKKVLPVEVGHEHFLPAPLPQRIEPAVGVLLAAVEEGEVVLIAIRGVVAEEAHAGVGVAEDEAAEVAGERLRAGADGEEVVVRREVAQLALVPDLLQREKAVGAPGAAPHVGLDDGVLLDAQVVEVGDERCFEPLRGRLERGVAFEDVA